MKRLGGTIALLTAMGAIAAAPASAADTRAEYAAQVNPICASANAEAERIYDEFFRKVRDEDGGNQPKRGGKRKAKKRRPPIDNFLKEARRANRRAAAVYEAALAQIELIPPAPGDESLVSTWIANERLIHEISERVDRLDAKREKLFNSRKFFVKKDRRLERKVNRLGRQIYELYEINLELGTVLGLTYCVTGATGPPPAA